MVLNFRKKLSASLVLVSTSSSFYLLSPSQVRSIECSEVLDEIDCMLLGTDQIKELIGRLRSIKINGNFLKNIASVDIEGPYPREKSEDERKAYGLARAFSGICLYFSERVDGLKNKIYNTVVYEKYEDRFLHLEKNWKELCKNIKSETFDAFCKTLGEIVTILEDLRKEVETESLENNGLLVRNLESYNNKAELLEKWQEDGTKNGAWDAMLFQKESADENLQVGDLDFDVNC